MNNAQKKFLMLTFLVCGCIATSLLTNVIDDVKNEQGNMQLQTENVKIEEKITTIRVYVSGAVIKPGLYDIPFNSRADEAIKIAGGFTELADKDRVNLARKLKDGVQVNVPTKKLTRIAGKNNTSEDLKQISRKSVGKIGLIININNASEAELQQLPGIGPAMAKRIIMAREKSKFSSVDDLARVKGIGKAKLERLKEYARAE